MPRPRTFFGGYAHEYANLTESFEAQSLYTVSFLGLDQVCQQEQRRYATDLAFPGYGDWEQVYYNLVQKYLQPQRLDILSVVDNMIIVFPCHIK